MEIKPIQGFESLYSISSTGKVFSIKSKITLNAHPCSGGYPKVALYMGLDPFTQKKRYKYRRVHRLVAEHFIANPNNYNVINHMNGIKTDNRVENLEWCTQQHNVDHAIATGLARKKETILSKTELAYCRDEYIQGKTIKDLAIEFGVSRNAIETHILDHSIEMVSARANQLKIRSAKSGKQLSKAVWQLSLDGVRIKRWDSYLAASKALGINAGNISNVVTGRQKSSGGFRWELE